MVDIWIAAIVCYAMMGYTTSENDVITVLPPKTSNDMKSLSLQSSYLGSDTSTVQAVQTVDVSSTPTSLPKDTTMSNRTPTDTMSTNDVLAMTYSLQSKSQITEIVNSTSYTDSSVVLLNERSMLQSSHRMTETLQKSVTSEPIHQSNTETPGISETNRGSSQIPSDSIVVQASISQLTATHISVLESQEMTMEMGHSLPTNLTSLSSFKTSSLQMPTKSLLPTTSIFSESTVPHTVFISSSYPRIESSTKLNASYTSIQTPLNTETTRMYSPNPSQIIKLSSHISSDSYISFSIPATGYQSEYSVTESLYFSTVSHVNATGESHTFSDKTPELLKTITSVMTENSSLGSNQNTHESASLSTEISSSPVSEHSVATVPPFTVTSTEFISNKSGASQSFPFSDSPHFVLDTSEPVTLESTSYIESSFKQPRFTVSSHTEPSQSFESVSSLLSPGGHYFVSSGYQSSSLANFDTSQYVSHSIPTFVPEQHTSMYSASAHPNTETFVIVSLRSIPQNATKETVPSTSLLISSFSRIATKGAVPSTSLLFSSYSQSATTKGPVSSTSLPLISTSQSATKGTVSSTSLLLSSYSQSATKGIVSSGSVPLNSISQSATKGTVPSSSVSLSYFSESTTKETIPSISVSQTTQTSSSSVNTIIPTASMKPGTARTPDGVPPRNHTFEFVFQGDCEWLIQKDATMLKSFWDCLQEKLFLELKKPKTFITAGNIVCNPMRITVQIYNIISFNKTVQVLEDSIRNLTCEIRNGDKLKIYKALQLNIISTITNENVEKEAELDETDIIMIAIASSLSMILMCIGFTICVREYYKRQRTRTFELSNRWQSEDYTLTKIPRPAVTYTDKGIDMNVTEQGDGSSIQTSNGEMETLMSNIHVRVNSNKNGLVVGVTGTTEQQKQDSDSIPSDCEHGSEQLQDLLVKRRESPLQSMANPIYYADED